MKKLDKTKPYGSVVGCDQGRAYEQDGVFFHGDGTEWQPPADGDPDADGHAPLKPRETKVVPKAAKPAVKPVKAVSAVDAQVNAQLQG